MLTTVHVELCMQMYTCRGRIWDHYMCQLWAHFEEIESIVSIFSMKCIGGYHYTNSCFTNPYVISEKAGYEAIRIQRLTESLLNMQGPFPPKTLSLKQ